MKKLGVYVSYNESENGPLADAVEISNKYGCVTWLDRFRLDPKKLQLPAPILIRVSGVNSKFYRGNLLAIASADDLPQDFIRGEDNHRPLAWRNKDGSSGSRAGSDYQTVLYISRLQELGDTPPPEIVGRHAPQHPEYVSLETTA